MSVIFCFLIGLVFLLAFLILIRNVRSNIISYLNSAIVTSIFPLNIVLMVTSIGIIFGSLMFGGMAEVAHKSFIYTDYLSVQGCIVVFFAVLLSEIILSNFYRRMGIPLSVTASLLFEFLGATVGISIMSYGSGEIKETGNYLNSGIILVIMLSFLISVAFAFILGYIVQWVSHKIFVFKRNRFIEVLFSGFIASLVVYLIIIKGTIYSTGLHIPETYVHFVQNHNWLVFVTTFIFINVLFLVLIIGLKLNALKLLVFIGIFALATSFASNDLAFFIGFPLAVYTGLNGLILNTGLNFTGLMENTFPSVSLYISIAGLIVLISLWIGKKFKAVKDMNIIPLQANPLAVDLYNRNLIAFRTALKNLFSFKNADDFNREKGFYTFPINKKKDNDNSINLNSTYVILSVSSILITIGTSMKLPLATTYIVFMVALGASMANKTSTNASPVSGFYEIITTIGSWFLTALFAFTFAFLLVLFLNITLWFGILFISSILFFFLIRSKILNVIKLKEIKNEEEPDIIFTIDGNIYDTYSQSLVSILMAGHKSLEQIINGLTKEKRKDLKEARKTADDLNDEIKKLKKQIPQLFKGLNDESFKYGLYYVKILESLQGALQCLNHIASPAFKYVDKNSKTLSDFQIRSLSDVIGKMGDCQIKIIMGISESDYSKSDKIFTETEQFFELLDEYKTEQLKLFRIEPERPKANVLYLDLLNELRKYLLYIRTAYQLIFDHKEYNKTNEQKR